MPLLQLAGRARPGSHPSRQSGWPGRLAISLQRSGVDA